MYGIKANCNYRKDCIHRDSVACNKCCRLNIQRKDYFEQDSEIVKNRFTETIMKRFNKSN